MITVRRDARVPIFLNRLAHDLRCSAKADDISHILGPTASSVFLSPSTNERFKPHSLAKINRTNPFRRMKLMATNT